MAKEVIVAKTPDGETVVFISIAKPRSGSTIARALGSIIGSNVLRKGWSLRARKLGKLTSGLGFGRADYALGSRDRRLYYSQIFVAQDRREFLDIYVVSKAPFSQWPEAIDQQLAQIMNSVSWNNE